MRRHARASRIKTGVIGYGPAFGMGPTHFNDMKRAGMVPSAVCDLDPARREAAAREFPGVTTHATVADMLKKSDADLIAVITPHNTHARLAIQCLNAGRHVVVEKPMALTTVECDAMIAAAKRNKVMLSVFHNRHWDGPIMHAVRTVRSGLLGEVVRVEVRSCGYGQPGDWWRSSKSISGGILYDMGVHFLEYTLQIIASDIVEVTGFARSGFWADKTAWKNDLNEDEAHLVVRYANGAWSTLTASSVDANPKPGSVEVTGTKGSFVFGIGYELILRDGAKTTRTTEPSLPGEWWRFYNNIAAHLVSGEPLIITPEWARRPIHIIDLANRSAAKGCALKAKYR